MKQNFIRPLLRWWITLTSVAAFVTGWVVLGHFNNGASADPAASPAQASSLPTLAPLPTLESAPSMRPIQVAQPSFQSGFRLRTGAS